MHRRIAPLSYLARLTGQRTARTNASEGIAILRKRRQDRELVNEYLQGRLLTGPVGEARKGERGAHHAERDL